jgi:hypothetical protein
VELPSVEPPVLLPVAGAAPIALEPLEGAPIAVLPGVVGPDMLLLVPGVPPALEPELEPLPCAPGPGPELPMLPLLPGVVELLATVGSQGAAPGAAPVVELEVCANVKPLAASAAATMLYANALIATSFT